MVRFKKRTRSVPINITVEIQCLLSALFLVASFFFLCVALLHPETERSTHGAQVSVDRVVLQISPSPLPVSVSYTNDTMPIETVLETLQDFLHTLHRDLKGHIEGLSDYIKIYNAYHKVAVEKLLPFEAAYRQHMPLRRTDDSIFLSIASYRDENCPTTLQQAYAMAKAPERLHVGLVQQNCVSNCLSGVLVGGKVEPVEPDVDCYAAFCNSSEGQPHCAANRVRLLRVDESESLGPYMARYFASKLWMGESWYLQIDAHSNFAPGWDIDSVNMLKKAPSGKPVISHYPPAAESVNFLHERSQAAPRICGGVFAGTDIEAQIVRLEEQGNYDSHWMDIPRFAPFVAAGYFVAHSDFLKEVPFDPFLPWIFMGEEIILSARFWTHGYDIFSPTHSVIGHKYTRRHKPKFWESVGRLFWPGVNNVIQEMVLHRVKFQLGYPESAPDLVAPPTVFTALENYTMGRQRSVKDYMDMVGLDPVRKEIVDTKWCKKGVPPEHAKQYAQLYPSGWR